MSLKDISPIVFKLQVSNITALQEAEASLYEKHVSAQLLLNDRQILRSEAQRRAALLEESALAANSLKMRLSVDLEQARSLSDKLASDQLLCMLAKPRLQDCSSSLQATAAKQQASLAASAQSVLRHNCHLTA